MKITIDGEGREVREFFRDDKLVAFLRKAGAKRGKGNVLSYRDNMPIMRMTQAAYNDILLDLGKGGRPPEAAGALMGLADQAIVTHYAQDKNAAGSRVAVTLDHLGLNATLKKYLDLGMNIKGFVHNHPSGITRLSAGDLEYVQQLFANPKNTDLTEVWMPVVTDGLVYPYIVYREQLNHPQPAQLFLC